MGRTPKEIAASMRKWPNNMELLAFEVEHLEEASTEPPETGDPPPEEPEEPEPEPEPEPPEEPPTEPPIPPEPPVQQAVAVEDGGLSVFFDGFHTVGRYCSGGWWVDAPAAVTATNPPSESIAGRIRHGAAINPSPRWGGKQPYDNACGPTNNDGGTYAPYDHSKNVAQQWPKVIQPGSSLVLTTTHLRHGYLDNGDGERLQRPQLDKCAIVTFVSQPQVPGSFRPPYCGTEKTARFNKSQLRLDQLNRLELTPSAPEMASVLDKIARPWLDHMPGWPARHIHPSNNMPDYGREMTIAVNNAVLLLNSDGYTDEEKLPLAIELCQLGIDLFGIVQDGGQNNWGANGGHCNGRKLPILAAGVLLGDQAMMSIGDDQLTRFGEDEQTFYVTDASYGLPVGTPEYGFRHATDPEQDDPSWTAKYRFSSAATFPGTALAARAMGVMELWKHNALFDYADRQVKWGREQTSEFSSRVALRRFFLEMWDLHRETL